MPSPIRKARRKTKGIPKDQMPTPHGVADTAVRAAKIMGANPAKLPEVLPFKSSLAFSFRMSGGVPAAIEAARMVSEKDVRFQKLVYAYDQLSNSDKEKIHLEDLCAAAEISSAEFLGLTAAAMHSRNMDISRIMAATFHHKIVEASIANAMDPRGVADRKMLHDHMGFLPLPAGQNIIIDQSHKTVNTGKGSEPSVEDTSKTALPSFAEETVAGAQALRGDAGLGSVGQKRLPAPRPEQAVTVPEEIIEAEVVDVQSE